jgi:hypothetical protein
MEGRDQSGDYSRQKKDPNFYYMALRVYKTTKAGWRDIGVRVLLCVFVKVEIVFYV